MRPAARTPEHYLHGGNVIVPLRVAAWLHSALPLNEARAKARGMDYELDQVLVALSLANQHWRASVHGTTPRNTPERKPLSAWLTATQAADLLNVTSRTVRYACERGQLPADRVGGQWQISREDFEHYRASRAA